MSLLKIFIETVCIIFHGKERKQFFHQGVLGKKLNLKLVKVLNRPRT